MKFTRPDFVLMRWSIAAVCASILLSSLILYSSNKYADSGLKDRNEAQRQMKDALRRLTMARQDQENLANFSKEYYALETRSILGDDHRLDWMETLEKLRGQDLVSSFNYSIAPQKSYAPKPAIDSGNFDIHYSDMKLQLDLLHEGQLLDFFTALRSQAKGWFQLDGCTLQRVNMISTSVIANATNIKAECSGGWITLKNRNAP